MALLILGKADFKARKINKHEEGHHIMINGSMNQEDIITLNVYALNH